MPSLEDYTKQAKAREEEEQRLGIATYQQKMEHRERRAILGDGYLERDSGTWKNALAFLRRQLEGKGEK
jgi:hypothetical protein